MVSTHSTLAVTTLLSLLAGPISAQVYTIPTFPTLPVPSGGNGGGGNNPTTYPSPVPTGSDGGGLTSAPLAPPTCALTATHISVVTSLQIKTVTYLASSVTTVPVYQSFPVPSCASYACGAGLITVVNPLNGGTLCGPAVTVPTGIPTGSDSGGLTSLPVSLPTTLVTLPTTNKLPTIVVPSYPVTIGVPTSLGGGGLTSLPVSVPTSLPVTVPGGGNGGYGLPGSSGIPTSLPGGGLTSLPVSVPTTAPGGGNGGYGSPTTSKAPVYEPTPSHKPTCYGVFCPGWSPFGRN